MHVRQMCACVNIFQEKILIAKPFSVAGKTALITGGGSGMSQFGWRSGSGWGRYNSGWPPS